MSSAYRMGIEAVCTLIHAPWLAWDPPSTLASTCEAPYINSITAWIPLALRDSLLRCLN